MAVIPTRLPVLRSDFTPLRIPEAATQSFKKGSVVKVGSNAVSVFAAAADVQLAIATEDATGTTGNKVALAKVGPTTLIEMSTDATALAATQIGQCFALEISGGIPLVDLSGGALNTGNARVKIVEILLGGPGEQAQFGIIGDTGCRVLVTPVLEAAGVDATTVPTGVGTALAPWF
jgi:hypothetical protein